MSDEIATSDRGRLRVGPTRPGGTRRGPATDQ
jgi:hypothetical protein